MLYDITSGTPVAFSQQAAVINVENGEFNVLGDVEKMMMMVPDYENMLMGKR